VPGLDALGPGLGLLVGGALLALVLWLGWRRPTLVFLGALASLAVRPELLWGGPEVGVGWGLHHMLIVFALAMNGARYGFRRTVNWPILALVAVFILSFTFGHRHDSVDLGLAMTAFMILALPWMFAQVVLEPGSRQRYAIVLALVPLLSVVISAILDLADIRPLFEIEAMGAFRLRGVAGIPADLALLAFGGFALALHESTRTTNRYFTYLAYLNFVLVVLSGTRMAIAASGLLFLVYLLLFPPMRARWRQNAVAAVLGLGVIALAGSLYLPNLEARMFGGDGAVSLSGREEMWSFYYDQFLMSPVFGRGLGTGFVAFAEHTSFNLPTPHNEYLHILVVGGVVGFALFFGAIALWFRAIIQASRWDDRVFVYALLPALALYAITENLLILPSALPIFAYLGIMRTRSMREAAAETGRVPFSGPGEHGLSGHDLAPTGDDQAYRGQAPYPWLSSGARGPFPGRGP
jgi:O-antigen ligase